MYRIKTTNKYEKDLKRIISKTKPLEDIETVIALLAADDTPLPEKYRDHALKGKYAAYRECHIHPNWLLVYKKDKQDLILLLLRTGTHAELFE